MPITVLCVVYTFPLTSYCRERASERSKTWTRGSSLSKERRKNSQNPYFTEEKVQCSSGSTNQTTTYNTNSSTWVFTGHSKSSVEDKPVKAVKKFFVKKWYRMYHKAYLHILDARYIQFCLQWNDISGCTSKNNRCTFLSSFATIMKRWWSILSFFWKEKYIAA